MRLKITMLVMLLMTAGCTTTQERFTALNQTAQEPQIYNQMVLENLANIMANPSAMPYFATLDSGIPQVADQGNFGGFWSFMPQTLVKQLHNQRGGQVGPLAGQRSIQSNWTLKPVNDDNRLMAMRCLYLWTLGHSEVHDEHCQKVLNKYYPPDEHCLPTFTLDMISQGWLQSGPWHKKPKNACYYVHKHLTAYWVDPEHEEDFTRLVLIILKIALQAPRTMTVKTFTYYPNGKLEREETRTAGYKPLPTKKPTPEEVVPLAKEKVPEIARQAMDIKMDEVISQLPGYNQLSQRDLAELRDIKNRVSLAVKEAVKTAVDQPGAALSLGSIESTLSAKFQAGITADISGFKTMGPKINPLLLTSLLDARQIVANAAQVASQEIIDEYSVLNALPDPDLKIDTFSNPEISPGLITLPH
jgi:hypothetical protein